MDILKIPFVETVGLSKSSDGHLVLEMTHAVKNHLNTIHASAQFTLAETASGQLLIESFPQFEGKVVPVLRDSQIKFKRPAETAVTAQASVSSQSTESFLEQLHRRGRGSIEISVEIKDANGKITSLGVFNWYAQSLA